MLLSLDDRLLLATLHSHNQHLQVHLYLPWFPINYGTTLFVGGNRPTGSFEGKNASLRKKKRKNEVRMEAESRFFGEKEKGGEGCVGV